jgi:putative flippase GtrA
MLATMSPREIFRFFRFAVVGGSVMVLHLFFVYVLHELLGWWYLVATTFSYACSIVVNFFLQKFLVWNRTPGIAVRRQFCIFSMLSCACLILNAGLMYVCVDILMMQYLVAQAGIVILMSLITYSVNMKFVFSGTDTVVTK